MEVKERVVEVPDDQAVEVLGEVARVEERVIQKLVPKLTTQVVEKLVDVPIITKNEEMVELERSNEVSISNEDRIKEVDVPVCNYIDEEKVLDVDVLQEAWHCLPLPEARLSNGPCTQTSLSLSLYIYIYMII